jgi:hypothetical protein
MARIARSVGRTHRGPASFRSRGRGRDYPERQLDRRMKTVTPAAWNEGPNGT